MVISRIVSSFLADFLFHHFMVPEGLQEEAALSASVPVADGNPEAEAEVAESTEVAVEGSTGFNWADASEDAPELTTAGTGVGGAASSALDEEEDFDILKFDALSLLDPVKPEEVIAEELFEALDADPASASADQPEASVPTEAENNLEVENPDNQTTKEEIDFSNNPDPQGTTVEAADTAADPIVGSSPSLAEVYDHTSIDAPVYVTYPADEAEEDEVPPPPTSPFLEQVGAASGASTSGHVQTGHSPAGPSRAPRVRGTKGGKKAQTKRLIQRWQSDFDRLAEFLWDEAEFWLRYVHHSEASAELIWTIRVFRVLYNHCTLNQILVHLANTFALIEIGSLPTDIEEVNCILLQILLQILSYLIGNTLTCKLLGTQIHLDPFGTTIIPIGVHSQKVRQKPRLVYLPRILNNLLNPSIHQP